MLAFAREPNGRIHTVRVKFTNLPADAAVLAEQSWLLAGGDDSVTYWGPLFPPLTHFIECLNRNPATPASTLISVSTAPALSFLVNRSNPYDLPGGTEPIMRDSLPDLRFNTMISNYRVFRKLVMVSFNFNIL